MTYRVDLGADEVIEMALPTGQRRAPGVSDDEQLRRLQDELRRINRKMNETDEGDPKMERLKKRYRVLLKKIRELGGDAPVRESYPGDDLTEEEERAVVDLVSGFAPVQDGEDPAALELSEDEGQDQPDENAGGVFGVFGVDDLLKIAERGDAELPEEVREDAETHEALRQQVIADRFGEDDSDLSDDEMWAEYLKTLGEEDK